MSFRLVPNSVTLDDLEWRNSPNGSIILPNLVALWTDCIKVVEDTPILQRKYRPKNLVFSDISFMAILAGDHHHESIKVRHSTQIASENLTNIQP